jgi:hypothetical protein
MVVGVVVLAFWSVLVAGYVMVYAPQQSEADVTARVTGLVEEKFRPRELTEEQRKKLVNVLDHVPLGEIYKLAVHVVANCIECSGYGDDLITVWKSVPRWSVQGTTNFNLKPRLSGIIVGVDPITCPSDEIRLIKEAFVAAQLDSKVFALDDEDKKGITDSCSVIIGSKPQK